MKKYFNFITDEVEIIFPDLFQPKAFNANEVPKYGCVILIKKDSSALIQFREALSMEAKQAKIALKSVNTLKSMEIYKTETESRLSRQLDTGKIDSETYKEKEQKIIDFAEKYKDYYITKAKTKKRPVLVDRYGKSITDEKLRLNGSIARLKLVPAYYEGFGGGVTLYLEGVQIIKLGTSGGSSEEQIKNEFGVYKGSIQDETLENATKPVAAKFDEADNGEELPF